MNDLFKPKIDYKQRYIEERSINIFRKDKVLSLLLDNSLITPTNKKRVDLKIIDCGDYKQIYYYDRPQLKKDKNLEEIKDISLSTGMNWGTNENYQEKLKTDIITKQILYYRFIFYLHEYLNMIKKYDYIEYLRFLYIKIKKAEYKKHINKINNNLKQIEYKNILRSRFELQRLVKANEQIFKTFITLTFADNISNIKEANKKFDIWRTKVKSIYRDFAYVCVPEFQKRGAIHYHLLTNLDIKQSPLIIIPQKDKKSQYDVKYWSYGFTSVFNMKDINVVGYISKYMTKDIDNRLWGHRRYLYSQNLKKPITIEINLNNLNEFRQYIDLINNDFDISYQNKYIDFLNNDVIYIEYKKRCDL